MSAKIDGEIKPALRVKGIAGKTLTAGQIGCVLNDIAATANQIDTLVMQLLGNLSNEGLADSLASAILALAQRIGWASDMAAERIPGSCGAAFGDASDWMMPPAFHFDDDVKNETGASQPG